MQTTFRDGAIEWDEHAYMNGQSSNQHLMLFDLLNEMGELLNSARHFRMISQLCHFARGKIGTGDEINEMGVNFTVRRWCQRSK